MGKDSYRAPEVYLGKVSNNSDLWALGILVLELYYGMNINKLYCSKSSDKVEFPGNFYNKNKNIPK